jgi:hypothetical protein
MTATDWVLFGVWGAVIVVIASQLVADNWRRGRK